MTREVKEHATGLVKVPQDYGEPGWLFIAATVLGLCVPLVAIVIVRRARLGSA